MEDSQKKLKILYLITKSNWGGAQRYVYDLALGAKARGHDVVVAFGGKGALFERLESAGVRSVSIPGLERDIDILADMRAFFDLLDLFARETPDIVHCNSSKMGGLGSFAARIWNIWNWIFRFIGRGGRPMRIVFTGHGWAWNEDRGDLERFLIACFHWLTIQLAHQTIAVSRNVREDVGRLPFAWHKLTVIHNGVGETPLLPRAKALGVIFGDAKERFLAGSPVIVGTLAELHKNKGLRYAIGGIAQLKRQTAAPIVFVILGEGEERAALEKLIVESGVESSVFLAGHKDEGPALLAAFDIFLLTSITEALGLAVLEAGMAGIPVVASAVGGIPEVIEDMQSGILIQSKNPGEVARALDYFISHPERRNEFGEALRVRVRERFGIEQMIDKTLALYRNN